MIGSSKAIFAPIQPNEPTLILAMVELQPSLENIIDGLIRTQSVQRVVAPAALADAPTEWSELEARLFGTLADHASVDEQEARDKEVMARSRWSTTDDILDARLSASIDADRRRLSASHIAPVPPLAAHGKSEKMRSDEATPGVRRSLATNRG